MASSRYTEGRLRRFILIHHDRMPFSRCGGLNADKWCALGIGIHVPKVGKKSGGSIDVLLMSRRAEFGVVEIKRRDNTERGQKPMDQAFRYIAGLRTYESPKELLLELNKKWESKGASMWIRSPKTQASISSKHEKAMQQSLGTAWEQQFRRAFRKLKRKCPPIFIVQNEALHPRTASAIRSMRRSGGRVWGIQVPFPNDQKRQWKVI